MILKSLLRASVALAGLVASSAIGQQWQDSLATRQNGGNLVFCHFMVSRTVGSIPGPMLTWNLG